MINPLARVKIALATFFLLLLVSCHSKKGVEEMPHWFTKYKFFSEANYEKCFGDNIASFDVNSFEYAQQVKNFYLSHQSLPFWTRQGYQQHAIDSMVTLLRRSDEHGLAPDMFLHSKIQARIDSLKTYKFKDEQSLYHELVQLEMDLTHAYILYTNALRFGVTDPEVMNGGKWLYKTARVDSTAVRQALEATDTIFSFIHYAQPLDSHYVAMTHEMARLLPLKDSTFKEIPKVQVDSNSVNKAVQLIGRRLQMTGELSKKYRCNDTLDAKVLAAINLFRTNNAIPVSSSLDEETINALNRPMSYYIDKLRINLERARWRTLPGKGPDCIVVNTADFTLRAARNGKVVCSMRICCGKTFSLKDSVKARTVDGIIQSYKSESPMLYGQIDQVVLNPEWFVPETIIKDEYYSKLCKDNMALLKKEHFFVYKIRPEGRGAQVLADTINWKKINPNKIPYILIQSSGSHNSLGRIKFNFPNSEYVYLHGSPTKSAFNKRVRALSHGCVRVEKPVDLAMVVFDYNEYDEEQLEQIKIQLGEKPKTQKGKKFEKELKEAEDEYYKALPEDEKKFYRPIRPTYVEMENQMPVFFEYFTAFLGENGHIQYRNDVYFKEQNVLNALNAMAK